MGIAPLSTRYAPNQMIATVEKLKMPMSDGIIIANRRVTVSWVSVRSTVGLVEAALLVVGAHERPDHADAGELLAHDLVHAVDLDLHRLEQRQRRAQHQRR